MRFTPFISLSRWAAVEVFRVTSWHDHFAWCPVNVGGNDWRWLETVERKASYDHSKNRAFRNAPMRFQYRAKSPTQVRSE